MRSPSAAGSPTSPRVRSTTPAQPLVRVDGARLGGLVRDLLARDPTGVWLDGGEAEGGVLARAAILSWEGDASAASPPLAPDRLRVWALSYEGCVDRLLSRTPRARRVPAIIVREYASWIEVAPQADRTYTLCVAGAPAARQAWIAAIERAVSSPPAPPARWRWSALIPDADPAAHRRAVEAALGHIAAGDTYQINVSHPWRARARDPAGVDALESYVALRERAPAPLGAYVATGWGALLSNSPETLLVARREAAGRVRVTTAPIKGTRPRGATAGEDRVAREALVASAKDAAEHVMIVDLLRNDLGRICEPGSVVAEGRPTCVTLPTVHHLVTKVSGWLRDDVDAVAALWAILPGGSVTGAPKRRAVELIEALECGQREYYCGAIVAQTRDDLVASLPIRTAHVGAGSLIVRGGGGIVADSDPDGEWEEARIKLRAFDAAPADQVGA